MTTTVDPTPALLRYDGYEAIDAEREALAVELAEFLTKCFNGPNSAEDMIRNLALDCQTNDRSFWREVITAIAQIRG